MLSMDWRDNWCIFTACKLLFSGPALAGAWFYPGARIVLHLLFRSVMRRLLASVLSFALFHAPAGAAEFAPDKLKLIRGQINQVLVLGTPHLSSLPKSFDLSNLRLLNERLANWKPQAIAIEELSGLQCAYLKRYPKRYLEVVQTYCPDTSAAQAATGLDIWEANAQVESTLGAWPASPSASQRRALAALFLAAGERASAAVQWQRLPIAEQHAGDGLNERLAGILSALSTRRDETYAIAVPLAVTNGLDRVYPMDDHSGITADVDERAYGEAISKAWANAHGAEFKRLDAALKSHLATPEAVLAMYRARNAQATIDLVFRSDIGAALEEPSAQHFGRGYVQEWEVRNLRMASNIREIMLTPGIRTLVIVGASHKGYLEAYLNQMHDVRVVNTDTILN